MRAVTVATNTGKVAAPSEVKCPGCGHEGNRSEHRSALGVPAGVTTWLYKCKCNEQFTVTG